MIKRQRNKSQEKVSCLIFRRGEEMDESHLLVLAVVGLDW